MTQNNELYFVDPEYKADATRIYHSWGLQQRTVDRLLYCGISTLEHLIYMTAEDTEIVFKDDSMLGEKILFRKSLKKWREHNGFDDHPDTNASTTSDRQKPETIKDFELKISQPRRCSWESDSSVPATANPKHLDVRDLLRGTHKGIKILNAYDKNCMLTNSEQAQICHIIVDHHMAKDRKMSLEQMSYYAKDIVKAFPSEVERTYFLPRSMSGTKCPQGKLFHRYSNENAKLKKNERDNTPSE
ncbi:uncharacterized protein LOC129797719 [Lutzomyia longipalpis]|uniref:uncharacterized protein LOC129797719 n=1 Tax=Lutzomyia longipalpis TaxID=7200 RepID=UPI0024839405|nr:uncharacterized protein LOC129797719 [Lutzomyia longipalpis]